MGTSRRLAAVMHTGVGAGAKSGRQSLVRRRNAAPSAAVHQQPGVRSETLTLLVGHTAKGDAFRQTVKGLRYTKGNGPALMERQRSFSASTPSCETDQVVFETIYREHSDYVYDLAYRLSGSACEADDLLQETFMRVHRYLSGYAGGSQRAWLRRIVVNLFLTRCKTLSRQMHLSLDQSEEDGRQRRVDEALLDHSGDPAWRMEQVSLDDRIQSSLDAIPAEFRLALVLRELEDLTYDQIASVLGVPIGTVRSRLARARALLRAQLGECGPR